MKQILLIISISLILLTNLFSQETIYIEANQFGHGIVKPKSSECFAIVPLHIVEESSDIKIIGEKNTKTKGELIQATTNDLAIVRAFGGGQLYCADWQVDEQFDRILENATEGVLKIRQNDGGIKWLQVDIAEFNETNITIEPSRQNKTFSKGMSGSALFTDVAGEKVCLGMLMNIDSQNNEGYVLQLDNILANLEDFFDLEKTKPTTNKTGTQESGVSESVDKEANINIVDKFKFEFKEIKRENEQVTMFFKVTNLDKEDRNLVLKARETTLYTNEGDQVNGDTFCIANNCTRYSSLSSRRFMTDAANLMPSGIPLNVKLILYKVSKEATSFVRGTFHLNQSSTFQMSNIEIPK